MLYQVYEAAVNDKFEFIGEPLLETNDLGVCCVMCYDLSKENTDKRYITWQENIQSLRENCCEIDRIAAEKFDPRRSGRILVRIDALRVVLKNVQATNDLLEEFDVRLDEENIIMTIERLQTMLTEEYNKATA